MHSCISTAVSHTGNLFVSSQLYTVFRLARRQKPYKVFPLDNTDFLDFKQLSKDLRILQSRDKYSNIKWNDVMEIEGAKTHLNILFYKSSHSQQEYSQIKLKRQFIDKKLLN